MNKKVKGLLVFLFSLLYQSATGFGLSLLPETIFEIFPVIAIMFSIDLLLMLILYLIYKKEIKEEWNIFKENWKELMLNNSKYWIMGLIAMGILNIIISLLISKDNPENQKIIEALIKRIPIYMIFTTTIVAPFTEEIIYRKSINDFTNNKYAYFIISGLLFGLAHVIYTYEGIGDFLYVLSYGALGYAFANMYYKSKTIFVPMTYHFLHNCLSILILFVGILIRLFVK